MRFVRIRYGGKGRKKGRKSSMKPLPINWSFFDSFPPGAAEGCFSFKPPFWVGQVNGDTSLRSWNSSTPRTVSGGTEKKLRGPQKPNQNSIQLSISSRFVYLVPDPFALFVGEFNSSTHVSPHNPPLVTIPPPPVQASSPHQPSGLSPKSVDNPRPRPRKLDDLPPGVRPLSLLRVK